MKKIFKKYISLLDRMKFREFMYVPVSIFFLLFIAFIVLGIHEIYVRGMISFIVFILFFSIPMPFQLYFILRLLQWLSAKVGLESLYKSIFKRDYNGLIDQH